MKPHNLIYLAGPMSGYPDFNAPAFKEAAKELRELGFKVFSPSELDEEHPLPASAPVTDFYRRDMPFLAEASVVVVLPGWQRSTGATYEVAIAANLFKIPVWEYPSLRPPQPSEIPQLTTVG